MIKKLLKKSCVLMISASLMLPPMLVEAASSTHRTSSSKGVIKTSASKARVKTSLRKKVRISRARNGQYKVRQANFDRSYSAADFDGNGNLVLSSTKALVVNQLTGETLYAKRTDLPTPIASVTKLMTAMVVLDAGLAMNEFITITEDDIDTLKGTRSRLSVGTSLTRAELLQLALIASENRAATALGRSYPGGIHAFVSAMNTKAKLLDMSRTHFVDSSGLNSANVSTAEDLVKMVNAAYQYPEIRQVTTTASHEVFAAGRNYPISFVNTNGLVRKSDWSIGLSKTGFINEAGRCLVMQANVAGQPLIIVLLDSAGKNTRIGDANRIRKWLEAHNPQDKSTPSQDLDALMLDRTLG